METKTCTGCYWRLPVEAFSRRSASKDKLMPICRMCDKEKRDKWQSKDNEGFLHAVYYLPEEHQVGVSTRVNKRISEHKTNGKITDGWEVVFRTNNHIEASEFEKTLHDMGYRGWNWLSYQDIIGYRYMQIPDPEPDENGLYW